MKTNKKTKASFLFLSPSVLFLISFRCSGALLRAGISYISPNATYPLRLASRARKVWFIWIYLAYEETRSGLSEKTKCWGPGKRVPSSSAASDKRVEITRRKKVAGSVTCGVGTSLSPLCREGGAKSSAFGIQSLQDRRHGGGFTVPGREKDGRESSGTHSTVQKARSNTLMTMGSDWSHLVFGWLIRFLLAPLHAPWARSTFRFAP